MNKIWEERRQIKWEDTVMNSVLSLKALNLILVGSAINHAEHLGFGFSQLSKENISWVLFRLNIKIERLPVLNEKIKVITWPRDLSGISASRDFQILLEESDELLCSASSDWMIIDLKTRKPQKMDRFIGSEYLNPSKLALQDKVKKLNAKCDFKELHTVNTYYSDLDMNGHVIASKYFAWLEDAIYKVHGDKKLAFLQMNYYNECLINEEISVKFCPENDNKFMGLKLNNNKVAFTAGVEFK